MSYNKHGEYELLQDLTHPTPYFVSRDRAGFHVLREGSPDGKERFSPIGDDGKKNSKKGRVYSLELLLDLMVP